MSDADENEVDALPELPDEAILEEVPPAKRPPAGAPLADLPDDVVELPDDAEAIEAPRRSVPEVPAPAKPKPGPAKPQTPRSPAVSPKAAVAPKPAPAKAPAPKPAAASAAQASGDDAEGKKQSAEEREAAKKERARQRQLELDRAAGRTGEKRELDQAPLVLRKASLIMGVAAIIPFATPAFDLWPMILMGKAFILLGGWIFHQSHVLKHEGKAPGFVASLAKSGPIPVYVVCGLLALAGFWPWADADAAIAKYDLTGMGADLVPLGIIAEKLILLLCLFTYTHIYDYEHGNKFNPIFPLMYLGGAIGGVGAIVKAIAPSSEKLGSNFVAALGAVGVTVGGCMAMWTMWLALKEAKAHGEAKKAAAAEARKAAREARRGKA